LKKIISILLIAALLLQTTSQLWILASFYINRNYIAANLCINRFDQIPVCKGSCYLEKQINESNKQQQEKLPELKLKEITLFCSSHTIAVPCPKNGADEPSLCLYKSPSPQSQFLQAVFRPPCLVVA